MRTTRTVLLVGLVPVAGMRLASDADMPCGSAIPPRWRARWWRWALGTGCRCRPGRDTGRAQASRRGDAEPPSPRAGPILVQAEGRSAARRRRC